MSPSPDSHEQGKAAVLFATLLTVAAGGAGLVVAGLVLGIDYLWHGEPHEREHLARQRKEGRKAHYADALAWLEADRADRARARAARRAWFDEDRATRGAAPSSDETVGRVLGRIWNELIVGGTRFARGWNQGREEARRRRDAGEPNWWKPPLPDRPDEPTTEPRPEPVGAGDPQQPPTGTQPTPPAGAEADIVEAEIVPDEAPAPSRDVVPVGEDEPPGPDVDEYGRRVDDLRDEVETHRNNHHADPSPPRTALPF